MGTHPEEGPLVDQLAGERRCTFGTNPVMCGEPAVLHLLVDDDVTEPGYQYTVYACLKHVDWWTTHEHRDRHRVGGACGLPDTFWLYSADDGPGHCGIDGIGDLVLVGVGEQERA